jgi:hypothetical protein
VAATRQTPIPGMYFSSLLGPQLTQEQIEHTMRLQLMVSGSLHLRCRPKASTATAYDNAGLCSSGGGPPCPGVGAGTGSSSSTGTSTRRSTDRNVPASALKPTLSIHRLEVFCHSVCPILSYFGGLYPASG